MFDSRFCGDLPEGSISFSEMQEITNTPTSSIPSQPACAELCLLGTSKNRRDTIENCKTGKRKLEVDAAILNLANMGSKTRDSIHSMYVGSVLRTLFKVLTESKSSSKKFVELYQHYITAAIDLAGGSAGGIACVLVGQPLDTLKVKMQTFPHLYKNSFICLKQTVLNERIVGLYAGTVPALVANVAENSVLFCAYGVCQNGVKAVVKKETISSLNPFENATAGFFAAFFSSVTLCPTELVKCRLQAMREVQTSNSAERNFKKTNIGPWILTKQILKNDGISGFFRGFGPTVAREMPGYFFFFGGYELVRILLTPKGKTKDEIGLLRTTIAGGIGGVSFWLAIFPFDVIKSRIQISSTNSSMIAITKEIMNKDGVKALYKGLGPTILRTFPASGALFVAYEYTKYFLHYISNCPLSSPVSQTF